MSRDFKLAVYNQAYQDVTKTPDLVVGMPIEDTVTWSCCRDQLIPSMKAVEKSLERIEVIQLVDGRDLRMRIYPYLNDQRELEGFVFELLDVTKLVKQERNLEETENLVEAITRVSPNFIYLREVDSGQFRSRN